MGVTIREREEEQHMEVENILLAAMCRMIHRTRRVYRKHVAVVRVVFLAAIVFLCALGVSGGSRILISAGMGKTSGVQTGIIEVQAAEVEETEATEQLQAGLMGVVNGAITMDAYSQAASEIDTASANENILVGAARASRTERRRTSLGKSAQSAQNVFSYAREVVKSHQMPESEYYTLLQIVEAEATGEDLEGKMLIANVIMNRVRDTRFPDTIEGVVWQQIDGSAQFQPTIDGRINTVEITQSTIEAVDRVLAGEDESQGALYFMARSGSDASSIGWFEENLTPLMVHGGHEYYTLSDDKQVS